MVPAYYVGGNIPGLFVVSGPVTYALPAGGGIMANTLKFHPQIVCYTIRKYF